MSFDRPKQLIQLPLHLVTPYNGFICSDHDYTYRHMIGNYTNRCWVIDMNFCPDTCHTIKHSTAPPSTCPTSPLCMWLLKYHKGLLGDMQQVNQWTYSLLKMMYAIQGILTQCQLVLGTGRPWTSCSKSHNMHLLVDIELLWKSHRPNYMINIYAYMLV